MRPLSPSDLLVLWERGAGLHAVDRALLALATTEPERDAGELARLPLGDRDARLLELRRVTLGDRLEAVAACPHCGVRVELELACEDLMAGADAGAGEWEHEHDGARLTLRALDSRDAAAAAIAGRDGGAEAARAALLARAVVAAERDGRAVAFDDLGPDAAAAVAAAVAGRDARAELLLDLTCPDCGHAWSPVLDVASFVWAELAARAERLLGDVHALARAYGWREADVLGLSEVRRATYVALAGT
jgi:hypothetical protein